MNEKRCLQKNVAAIKPLQLPSVVSPEELRVETDHGQALSPCSHPQRCTLRGLRMGKHGTLAPES